MEAGQPKLDIHLYMTTHDDDLPNLNTMDHIDEVRQWFSQVDNVAVHHDHFSKIDEGLLKEASKHHIMNAHSIVFYPPGQLFEANAVGKKLGELFDRHGKKNDWHIAANPQLKDTFEVYLEITVKSGSEGGKVGDAMAEERDEPVKPSFADRNKAILAEVEGEKPPAQ